MRRMPIASLCLILWAGVAGAQDASRIESEAASLCDYVAGALTPEVDRIAGTVAANVLDARGDAAADRLDARFHAADFMIDVGRAYADSGAMGFMGEVALKTALAKFALELEGDRANFDRIKSAIFAAGAPDDAVLGEAEALAGRLEIIRNGATVAVLAAMEINDTSDYIALANRVLELIPAHAQVDLIDRHGFTVPMVAELELGGIEAADARVLEAQQIAARVLACVAARRAELDRVPIEIVTLSGPANLVIAGEDYSVEFVGRIALTFSHQSVGGRLEFPDDDREFGLYSQPVNDDGAFRTGYESRVDGRWIAFEAAGRVVRDRSAPNGWRAEGRFVLDEASPEDDRRYFHEAWGEGASIGGSWQAQ